MSHIVKNKPAHTLKRYLEFPYKCKLQGIKQRLKAKANPEAEALPDALTKSNEKETENV
jgi:hypothetical protein